MVTFEAVVDGSGGIFKPISHTMYSFKHSAFSIFVRVNNCVKHFYFQDKFTFNGILIMWLWFL